MTFPQFSATFIHRNGRKSSKYSSDLNQARLKCQGLDKFSLSAATDRPVCFWQGVFISGFPRLRYYYPVINGRSLKIQSFKQINQMSSNQHIQLHNTVRSRVLISTTILAGDGQYRFCTISLLATKFYLQFDHS